MITRSMRLYEAKLQRRLFILGGLQGCLTLGLAGRLYYLQIEEGRQYQKLSDENKYDFRIIPPSRGRIHDRAGRLLAGNAEAYELSVIPQYIDDLDAMLARLGRLIDLSSDDIEAFKAEVGQSPSFLPIRIRADLTQREVSRIAVRSPELPGVSFEKVERRIYPQGVLSGHLTGYTNRATAEDVESGVIGRELANLSTGKSGIEKAFENHLRGFPGRERILVNALGRPIRTAIDDNPRSGNDLTLTINIDDQFFAIETLKKGQNKPLSIGAPAVQQALAEDEDLAKILADGYNSAFEDAKGRIVPPETGSVVVLDIKTGAVKILASSPTFDPNLFSGRLSSRDWNMLTANPRTPLLDRSLSGHYSPGSVFKMVVALAGLEAGLIDEKTRFHCNGRRRVGDQDFHCWQKDGHGTLGVTQAIEQSCDVFFYETGLKLGVKRIALMAQKLGLGVRTGIAIPGEKAGLIPTKAWKAKTHGTAWTSGETVNTSIGQGYVLTTPLQLAVMTARLADGKRAITPRLTVDELSGQGFAPLDISAESLGLIQGAMRGVMSGAKGTARRYDLSDAGYPMAGKTGTVQVRAISKAEREAGIIDNIDRPWKFRDHALFVSYAPYDDPRYAIAVVVEHGGSGSSTAAPIARAVLRKLLERGV